MTTWVALLRGVNVNGITIRSTELAELFREALGFHAVKTVLASGNVRFDTDAPASARAMLKATIEKALRERFDYDAWIVLATLDELSAAIDGYPFDAGDAARQPYVIFCSIEEVHDELADAAASADRDEDPTALGAGVIYWSPAKGRSVDTPFAKLLAKSRYKATTTTRNLRTLQKIHG
ncbi:MAG: hypothetical protein ABS63_11435 [Microbacterium sp. SCN 70-27]|uniref:DUF1697 domain-containing protein n=1 Tax=unclassified Microbacterium TaxID=2609290 RepID=UPI00086A5D90|nr:MULTISPECIES: DUF1697 domain-containing protein [unclassified Microbacterium]MBN9223261.1 DUF1697 domain-containing protein [Microbacterium sp.]ODT26506.1 MAG: hypothetical protein ABS63_11435 [Microbacterium sp. SCN 70-27]